MSDPVYGNCTCGRNILGYTGFAKCSLGDHLCCLHCRVLYTSPGLDRHPAIMRWACTACAEATMKDSDKASSALDALAVASEFIGIDWAYEAFDQAL